MKKQLTEKTTYEPNRRVKVTVQNKPEFDEDKQVTRYERKVTIAVDCGYSNDKISFSSDDEISQFLEEVDVEDNQQSLLDGVNDDADA